MDIYEEHLFGDDPKGLTRAVLLTLHSRDTRGEFYKLRETIPDALIADYVRDAQREGRNRGQTPTEPTFAMKQDGSMIVYADFMDRRRAAPRREQKLPLEAVTTLAPEGRVWVLMEALGERPAGSEMKLPAGPQ
eukprot:2890890-Amphidinium_carterae.2